MPRLIEKPTVIDCVGTKPKQVQAFAGRVNCGPAGALSHDRLTALLNEYGR